MIIRVKTTTFVFEINSKFKRIRRAPDNIPGSWKEYIRVSKPIVGAPLFIIWSIDDNDNPTKTTITTPIIAYEYIAI